MYITFFKLYSNIISFGQMAKDGNEIHMVGETMKVFDKTNKILMWTKNLLYKITLKTSKHIYILGSLDDLAWL